MDKLVLLQLLDEIAFQQKLLLKLKIQVAKFQFFRKTLFAFCLGSSTACIMDIFPFLCFLKILSGIAPTSREILSMFEHLWSSYSENCVKFQIFQKNFPLSDWQANSIDFEPFNFKNLIFIFNRNTFWNCCEPIRWIIWRLGIAAFFSFLKRSRLIRDHWTANENPGSDSEV